MNGQEFYIIKNAMLNLLGQSNQESAIFPATMIDNYYNNLSNEKRLQLSKIILDYYFENGKIGTEIDNHIWIKFALALDPYYHETIEVGGEKHTFFILDGKLYSKEKYLENPAMDTYITSDTFEEHNNLLERLVVRFMHNWVRDTQTLNIENYKNKDLFGLLQVDKSNLMGYIYLDWIKPGNYTRWDLILDLSWGGELSEKSNDPKKIKKQYLLHIDEKYKMD